MFDTFSKNNIVQIVDLEPLRNFVIVPAETAPKCLAARNDTSTFLFVLTEELALEST